MRCFRTIHFDDSLWIFNFICNLVNVLISWMTWINFYYWKFQRLIPLILVVPVILYLRKYLWKILQLKHLIYRISQVPFFFPLKIDMQWDTMIFRKQLLLIRLLFLHSFLLENISFVDRQATQEIYRSYISRTIFVQLSKKTGTNRKEQTRSWNHMFGRIMLAWFVYRKRATPLSPLDNDDLSNGSRTSMQQLKTPDVKRSCYRIFLI